MPEPTRTEVPLAGFTAEMSRLAKLETLLYQLIWVTAKADPSKAPQAAVPVLPHEKRRQELKRAKRDRLFLRLIPGGG